LHPHPRATYAHVSRHVPRFILLCVPSDLQFKSGSDHALKRRIILRARAMATAVRVRNRAWAGFYFVTVMKGTRDYARFYLRTAARTRAFFFPSLSHSLSLSLSLSLFPSCLSSSALFAKGRSRREEEIASTRARDDLTRLLWRLGLFDDGREYFATNEQLHASYVRARALDRVTDATLLFAKVKR